MAIAVVSAATFGLSGPIARMLIEAGWTPGAAVNVRVLGAAAVLTVPALRAMRGRWPQLRRKAPVVASYGVFGVAVTQLCYFYAVGEISVTVALLIEFTAPVAVIGWMWARHDQRPSRRTAVGAVVALSGLVLVLDLVATSPSVNLVGVLWAFGAMGGVSVYFVLSADTNLGLPPIVLVWGGLVVGGAVLGGAGAVGVLPLAFTTDAVQLSTGAVAWWVPVLTLIAVPSVVAYCTGVVAARRLGSRLASFVALTEVVAATLYAWAFLGELPVTVQLAGGLLILTGIVVVKLGEDDVSTPRAGPVPPQLPA